jgi:hypothetical protein
MSGSDSIKLFLFLKNGGKEGMTELQRWTNSMRLFLFLMEGGREGLSE